MKIKTINEIVKSTKCSKSGLELHYDSIVDTCNKYEINTPLRFAAFMANVLHETSGFRAFEENLRYTNPESLVKLFRRFDLDGDRVIDQEEIEFAKGFLRNPEKLANYIYGNRYGNSQNEGWKYRGRGIFQTTFKDNYYLVSKALKVDFVTNPELLINPPYAAQSAGFYWFSHKLNIYADSNDMITITKRINGGMNGYEDRLKYYNAILKLYEN